MGVDPGYGETPLEPDEASSLTSRAREIFGDEPRKIDLYEAEQAVADDVGVELFARIVDGTLHLDNVLTDGFLRDLHRQLYGDLWTWAGRYRIRELSIGVDPINIAVDLRSSFESIRYRWEHTDDWTPRELGIVAHAESVRIHAFVDGNGRASRLLADLVFFAAQNPDMIAESYDWAVDKRKYIGLLREYDISRDVRPLAAFIPVKNLRG